MLTTSTGLGPELELFGCGVTSFEIPKDEDLIYCPRPAAPEEEKTGRWVSNREYYGKRPHGIHRHEYRTGDRYVKN